MASIHPNPSTSQLPFSTGLLLHLRPKGGAAEARFRERVACGDRQVSVVNTQPHPHPTPAFPRPGASPPASSFLPNPRASLASEGLTINGHHGEAARMPRATSLTELVYQPDSFNSPESTWNPKQPLFLPPRQQAFCLPLWSCLNKMRAGCVWTRRPGPFPQCQRTGQQVRAQTECKLLSCFEAL